MRQDDATQPDPPFVVAEADDSLKLPPVVIIDPSAFNCSCIAASLRSDHFPRIHEFASVRDVPADLDCRMAVLFSNAPERDVERLDKEIIQAERRWPGIAIIILLGCDTPAMLDITQSLTHMPAAVVTGEVTADLLIAALRLAYNGHAVVPLTLLRAQALRVREAGQPPSAGRYEISEDHPLLLSSTTRQREVMRLLVTGLSNKAIAQQLMISESTVKAHIRAIMETLGVNNRTQIVARVMNLYQGSPADRRPAW